VGHHNAATTARWFAVGNAARNGLNAALAAQQGFTSDRKLLEGRVLPDVLGITPNALALADGLGGRTALTEVSFKPWCAARQTMAATQALKDIIAGGVAPAAIDAIAVAVPPPQLKMIDHGVVAGDRASHLTSVQYAMAAAALAPEMAFDVQQAPPDLPPPVRALMAKIKVKADERLLADYPESWPARARVAAGLTRHARDVTHVPGDPALPFDRARVREKFLRFTQPVLGAETAERILARCGGVLATGEISQLMDGIERACSTASLSPSGERAMGSGS
jgi:2-methylcitrate dehydratase PrpD